MTSREESIVDTAIRAQAWIRIFRKSSLRCSRGACRSAQVHGSAGSRRPRFASCEPNSRHFQRLAAEYAPFITWRNLDRSARSRDSPMPVLAEPQISYTDVPAELDAADVMQTAVIGKMSTVADAHEPDDIPLPPLGAFLGRCRIRTHMAAGRIALCSWASFGTFACRSPSKCCPPVGAAIARCLRSPAGGVSNAWPDSIMRTSPDSGITATIPRCRIWRRSMSTA